MCSLLSVDSETDRERENKCGKLITVYESRWKIFNCLLYYSFNSCRFESSEIVRKTLLFKASENVWWDSISGAGAVGDTKRYK